MPCTFFPLLCNLYCGACSVIFGNTPSLRDRWKETGDYPSGTPATNSRYLSCSTYFSTPYFYFSTCNVMLRMEFYARTGISRTFLRFVDDGSARMQVSGNMHAHPPLMGYSCVYPLVRTAQNPRHCLALNLRISAKGGTVIINYEKYCEENHALTHCQWSFVAWYG